MSLVFSGNEWAGVEEGSTRKREDKTHVSLERGRRGRGYGEVREQGWIKPESWVVDTGLLSCIYGIPDVAAEASGAFSNLFSIDVRIFMVVWVA